jgi:hypothetical protein
VAEAEGDEAAALGVADPADEGLEHARASPPGEVEAGDGVAVPGGERPAPLRPADDREEADPLRAEPGALLARGPGEVGLSPAAGPEVLGAVEAGGAQPVLEGEVVGVADPEAALLRGVDQEEPAERPEGLAAERQLALLLEDRDAPAGVGQLRGGGEAGEPGTDDDDVAQLGPPSGQGQMSWRRIMLWLWRARGVMVSTRSGEAS